MKWKKAILFIQIFVSLTATEVTASESDCDQFDLEVTTTPVPPQSRGGLKRHAELIAEYGNVKPDVLILGDSIAHWWPAPLLASFVGEKTVLNWGDAGDRTQNLLWRLGQVNLRKISPKDVVLIIGTNNLLDRPCGIVAGVEAVVSKLQQAWPRATIFVVSILPRGIGYNYQKAYRESVNASLKMRLENRPGLVLLNLDQEMSCQFSEPCENYIHDMTHLSPLGYTKLGESIAGHL